LVPTSRSPSPTARAPQKTRSPKSAFSSSSQLHLRKEGRKEGGGEEGRREIGNRNSKEKKEIKIKK
jgi:hypothetical protein